MESNAQIAAILGATVSLLVLIIRLVGPYVDQAAMRWALKVSANEATHLPASIREIIHEAAIFGAQAAEQMSLAQRIANTIDAKKNYAVQAAERWLKAQGYTIDLETIGDAIETVILQGLHLPPPNDTPQTAQAGNSNGTPSFVHTLTQPPINFVNPTATPAVG